MMKYLISIVVPVFNVEKYIGRAMESLLQQTFGFENLEIIYVDDCSTDKSGDLIDGYAGKYTNVTAIHLPHNSGAAGVPRNEALKLATSDYIMFLDPDDYYSEDACESLYKQIQLNGSDLVFGYYSEIDEAGLQIVEKTKAYEQFEEKCYSVENQYNVVLQQQNAFWSKIYKRAIITENEIDFPPRIPGQDTVFLCRYLLCCRDICYINRKIVYYRLREKSDYSISNRCDLSFFDGIQSCFNMIYDIMTGHNKGEDFVTVIKGVLDYYLAKMLDSDSINDDEMKTMLQKWEWIFSYFSHKAIPCETPYARMILASVDNGNLDYSISLIKELKPMRRDLLNVIEGRNWLANQFKIKDEAIAELQNWASKQEEAISFYMQKAEAAEKSLKDVRPSEEKLASVIADQEKEIDYLVNQNKKLTFYLKEEINKSWFQKILHKSSEADYKL